MNTRNSIFIVTGLIFILLLHTSCNNNNKNETNRSADYQLLEVQLSNETLENNYSVTIRGRQDIEILPQVSGKITKVNVTEGEAVRKDQILFVIDQMPYISALKTAMANFHVAQATESTAQLTYDSKKQLFDKNIVSDFDLRTAENALIMATAQKEQAQAQLEDAQNNLSYTEVKAPCNGVVGMLPYRMGSLVSPSMSNPLTTVSDNSEMYVYFSMDENAVLNLSRTYGSLEKAAQMMPAAKLRLSDGTIYEYEGKIESISGVISLTTGTASVRAVFPNPNDILHSGATGSIVIPQSFNNVIVIPQEATFEIQNKVFTYKVVDGKAKTTTIEVASINDGKAYLVNSGLNEGDVIVSQGAGLLREGTVVTTK